MSSCDLNLFSKLVWCNLKLFLYVSIWIGVASVIVYSIWASGSVVKPGDINTLLSGYNFEYWSEFGKLSLEFLPKVSIFLLTILLFNSTLLLTRDNQKYKECSYRLDDPKVRVRILIESINASDNESYYLRELRPDYYRLANRDKNLPHHSVTVFEGSLTSIKKCLSNYVQTTVREDKNLKLLFNYNMKCLELCNIKYFNLVKSKLFT